MKTLNLTLILCSLSFALQAQTAKDFFSNKKATLSFVGLDFSQATFVNTGESASKNKGMFEVWNSLMVREAEKFDINKAFGRANDPMHNIEVTAAVNEEVDAENINSYSNPKSLFEPSKIQTLVEAYNTDEIEAEYAVSLIVHSFNKGYENAVIYITLFDPKTKKVLWSKKVDSEPSGFGYRNYWAGTVNNTIKTIKKNYKKWGKKI